MHLKLKMDMEINQSLDKVHKICSQICRIFWVGSDPEGSWSPTRRLMSHTGIEPTILVFLSPGYNQLLSGRECLNVPLK